MTAKEWLVRTFKEAPCGLLVREHAVCADGFTISIQASRWHYCVPRETIATGDYTYVELGFPSEREKILEKFREGTVYPYVPIEVVEKVMQNHGGIV